jgi:hypothetical protein
MVRFPSNQSIRVNRTALDKGNVSANRRIPQAIDFEEFFCCVSTVEAYLIEAFIKFCGAHQSFAVRRQRAWISVETGIEPH